MVDEDDDLGGLDSGMPVILAGAVDDDISPNRAADSPIEEDIVAVPSSASAPSSSTSPRKASSALFSAGDRIEANYRGQGRWYSGKVGRDGTVDGTYDIEYDDGEREVGVPEGLIRAQGVPETTKATALAPSKFADGDKVEANYKGKGTWYSGKISRVRANGAYDIEYDDGERELGVAEGLIRALDIPDTSVEVAVTAAETTPKFADGVQIEANYKGKGTWYSGKISRVRANGTYDVAYDDGERELGMAEGLIRTQDIPDTSSAFAVTTAQFADGDKVEGNYKGKGTWYPGRISRIRGNDLYDIAYDDNTVENNISATLIRSLASVAAASDPTSSSSNGGAGVGLGGEDGYAEDFDA